MMKTIVHPIKLRSMMITMKKATAFILLFLLLETFEISCLPIDLLPNQNGQLLDVENGNANTNFMNTYVHSSSESSSSSSLLSSSALSSASPPLQADLTKDVSENEICKWHTKKCMDECNPKLNTYGRCLAECVQDPSTAYFDIMLPVTDLAIRQECTKFCSGKTDTEHAVCFNVCKKGFKDHYIPEPDHAKTMCTTPNPSRFSSPSFHHPSHHPDLSTANDPSHTCVQQSRICIETCEQKFPPTDVPVNMNGRATCLTQCTHDTAVALYDVGLNKTSNALRLECHSDQACMSRSTSLFYASSYECAHIDRYKFPDDGKSHCHNFCYHWYGLEKIPIATCTHECEKTFAKYKRKSNNANCVKVCEPKKPGPTVSNVMMSRSDGCLVGCFNQ